MLRDKIITLEKHKNSLGEMETTHNSIVESRIFLWLNDHDGELLLSPPGSLVPVSIRVRRDDRSNLGALVS